MTEPRTYNRPAQDALRAALDAAREQGPPIPPTGEPMALPDAVEVLTARVDAARRYSSVAVAAPTAAVEAVLDELARPARNLARQAATIPGARTTDPATSHAAAAKVSGTPTTRNQLGRLLVAFYRWSEQYPAGDHRRGLTSEEAANLARVLRSEYAKRCSELAALGHIRVARHDDGQPVTRRGASGMSRQVYELTDAGRELARRIEVVAL